jgi:clarin
MKHLLPKVLIFLTFFVSCFIIGLLLSALVTTAWIRSDVSYLAATGNGSASERSKYGFVQFGLFNYLKTLNHGYGERNHEVNVIDIVKRDDDNELGNYWLWLFTALGTGFSLFASSIAAVASVVGTIKEKGGMALILTSNVVSGIGQFVALVCWAIQFVVYLNHNVLLKVDQDKWTSKDQATFGYSFYFILLAFSLIILNVVFLMSARRAESRFRRNLERPIDEKEGNSIMLY